MKVKERSYTSDEVEKLCELAHSAGHTLGKRYHDERKYASQPMDEFRFVRWWADHKNMTLHEMESDELRIWAGLSITSNCKYNMTDCLHRSTNCECENRSGYEWDYTDVH